MVFYGNGVVWDGVNNRPLCHFKNGKLETTDDAVCQRLTALNYPCVLDDNEKALLIPEPRTITHKTPQRKAVKK